MLKKTILGILALSTLVIQCKKDSSTAPETIGDTVIVGKVSIYDQFGMKVSAMPTVAISAWLADSIGTQLGNSRNTVTDAEGAYRIDSLKAGLYSIRYSAEGYGDYVQNKVRFDSLGGIEIPEVKLTTFAAGSVQLNSMILSPLSPDSGVGNSAIVNIDRDVIFGAGSSAPFQLKIRFFFGLDSIVTQGNCLFSYISGAVEGSSGSVNNQIVKFGLPNLKTYFQDSSLIYVSAAVETAPSQIYTMGEKVYYPNVKFPLSSYKTIDFILNAND